MVETISFSLNDIYKLFNYSQKFEELLKKIKEINWETVDEEIAKKYIKSMSFIFDITKKTNPISYAVFYSMQYAFWQVVVAGGILTNKKFSAKLLLNSLATLHDATMFVKANKDKENKWNFEIEVIDTYDFTDFKELKEYADGKDIKSDIFSTLLNNLGVVSSEYGVIKIFDVKIKFKTKEGEF